MEMSFKLIRDVDFRLFGLRMTSSGNTSWGRGRGGEGRRQMLRDRLRIIRTCVNRRAVLHPKGAIGNIWGHFCSSHLEVGTSAVDM